MLSQPDISRGQSQRAGTPFLLRFLVLGCCLGFSAPAAAGFDIPTGAPPSPLFGAKAFTQPMLRFEEFGTHPMPGLECPGCSTLPVPADTWNSPDSTRLDAFLSEPLSPLPTRAANPDDPNPWQARIEESIGKLSYTVSEGRPPGEFFAHQRWKEFYPAEYFKTAQSGARSNRGLRDKWQAHGFQKGEFGPDGLYHRAGSNEGTEVRLHPNMPVQHPEAVWTFDGTLPPKLLMARYGVPILFRHYNALPIDARANEGFGIHTITTHEHNGHYGAESDGYAQAYFYPGQYYDYRWPLILAGYDSINTGATDYRAGTPDGAGGIIRIPGDWRETMSTHWFHDHMLDYTAQNVYKGNAAMMNYYSALDRGNEGLEDTVNLRLPSGTKLDWGNRDYDINLMIADKAWDEDGQLYFNIFNKDGFMGDRMTVNWLYKPYLDVRARRYRFRILNGSVSRYLKTVLVDQKGNRVPFYLIANDGNIMEHAVHFDGTKGTRKGQLPTHAIAERYDIIIDFSGFKEGDRLYFVNVLEHKNGKRPEDEIDLEEVLSGDYDGDPAVGKFLEFRVRAYKGTDLSMDPAGYVAGKKTMLPRPKFSAKELENAKHRSFKFGRSNGTDSAPWTIKTDGGTGYGMDPQRVSAAPDMGTVEIWHLETGGGWSHPVHVHFEEGQILTRGGKAPPEWEKWARKDVYRIGRMEDSTHSVSFAIRFREFAGSYMEHCHNTQHEDHAMLLRWDIEVPGQVIPLPAPMPGWDGVGYAESWGLPTYKSGDRGAAEDHRGFEFHLAEASSPPEETSPPPEEATAPPKETTKKEKKKKKGKKKSRKHRKERKGKR